MDHKNNVHLQMDFHFVVLFVMVMMNVKMIVFLYVYLYHFLVVHHWILNEHDLLMNANVLTKPMMQMMFLMYDFWLYYVAVVQ